ncbi:MAG: adenine deaminase [Lachnospiraceae bacterium]
MRRLLKNGKIVNVFTKQVEKKDVLIDGKTIVGVGEYAKEAADLVEDVEDKVLCPGLIDGHIHLESTMLLPQEFAKIALPHGTTSIVADPHEIANVCGTDGIDFLLEAVKGIPLHVYFMLPSCVPATANDENGATLTAKELKPYYQFKEVLGLGEMMNYYGVIRGQDAVMQKIADARAMGKKVDGHAPLLSGEELDVYIAAGIGTDHECSNMEEAIEKLGKGQWIMIREGSSARNLNALLPLFDEPYCHRCLLVTDDRHPADILEEGHIDQSIRKAVKSGKSVLNAIQMATLNAANCFGLEYMGVIAPGYRADILVLDDLERFSICDVYADGEKVVNQKNIQAFAQPHMKKELEMRVRDSFHLEPLTEDQFRLKPQNPCRIIGLQKGELITDERIEELNWEKGNGIDLQRDILKLAVIERHKNTQHRGVGFIQGIGLKKGAIASSVSHDSHNLIVIGTNEKDMAYAANRIREMGGGYVAVSEETVLCELALPIAGLFSEMSAEETADRHNQMTETLQRLGVQENRAPFMDMAFLSLSVIPHVKMTTKGLIDVDKQEYRSLQVVES